MTIGVHISDEKRELSNQIAEETRKFLAKGQSIQTKTAFDNKMATWGPSRFVDYAITTNANSKKR